MTLAQEFNSLNGLIVHRKDLEKLLEKADRERHAIISKRIIKVLEAFADDTFLIEIKNLVEPFGLNGADDITGLLGGLEYISEDEDSEGLNKAVSPDDIYSYITDLILNTIKQVGHLPWQKDWTGSGAGNSAMNFVSKKEYTGANYLLNFDVKLDENGEGYLVPIIFTEPYYLTFNQIREAKASLKKDSKARRVIYYTMIHKYDNGTLKFQTSDRAKWMDFLTQYGLTGSEHKKFISNIPVIKYYNVFRADDCTGLKYPAKKPQKNSTPIEQAQEIIDGYKNPPKYTFAGDKAFYQPASDILNMPTIGAFNNEASYYSTFFHEAIHSTGHSKRLNRGNDTRVRDGGKKDKEDYAFEELVAELGAVYLSGEAGILFHTRENSAKYLHGWNQRLVGALKEDNRFFLKASAKAQKGANHILGREVENGETPATPKKEVEKEPKPTKTKVVKKPIPAVAKVKKPVVSRVKKTASDYGKKRKFVSKKGVLVQPFSVKDIPYDVAYRAHTGTSFSPEKRAESEQKSYVQFLNDVWNEQLKIAEKKGFLDIFEERFLRFKDGYLSRSLAYLRSRHGVFSTMIAGGSNFPVARMNKKNNIVNSRLTELSEYGDKYQHLFKKELQPVIIKTGSESALSQLEIKLKKEEEAHEKTLVFNKIMRKKTTPEAKRTELLNAGFSEEFITRAEKSGFTTLGSYVSTNASARIRNLKAQIELENKLKAKKETGNKEKVFDEGKAVWNYDLNRFQLIFDGKPSDEIRSALKGGGLAFKWSPREMAWQRQLNTFGRYNWERLVKIFPSLEQPAPKEPTKGEPESEPEPVNNPQEKIIVNSVGQIGLFGSKKSFAKARNRQTLAQKIANKPTNVNIFKIEDKGIAGFLGKIERKEKESVVISLTGGQGSMKTRMCFQFMNALAQNYAVGHASIEEHPESGLYYDKATEYLNNIALQNIEAPEIKTIQDLETLCKSNDVIVIDSFTKLQEMHKGFEIDKDLRKKYNGKLFIVIFQQTTDGKMRGGSKSQFDADIVLFTKKEADYRNNYIYADKNRYQNKPLDGLQFNIFSKKLLGDTPEAEAEPKPKPKLTFNVN